jgi:dinuclear metal center YbgI/SA1388 family protein
MTTVNEVLQFLKTIAPLEYQESWDNAGLLCGHGDKEVSKVVIALDPFMDTAEEAKRLGAGLIVTHHPLMFSAKTVNDMTPIGKTLLYLIENQIAAIAMHTNLDSAPGGVNDCLAEALGLSNCTVLDVEGTDACGREYGCGRVGEVSPCTLQEFLTKVKERLGCHGLRYADAGRPVRKVAVGGGACASYLEKVAALGCDTFVTSDVKYNGFADSVDLGVNMIDAGHFSTENPVCQYLLSQLESAFPTVTFVISQDHQDVVRFW